MTMCVIQIVPRFLDVSPTYRAEGRGGWSESWKEKDGMGGRPGNWGFQVDAPLRSLANEGSTPCAVPWRHSSALTPLPSCAFSFAATDQIPKLNRQAKTFRPSKRLDPAPFPSNYFFHLFVASMCFLFLLFAIVASTSIYRYTLLYHLCPIPSIESASSFFPTKRFRIKDIRVEYYANKINGRKLSRLFDYDLKSIYVYCYRVNFLSLDIRYFHRTVKNIYIFQYDNGTCLPKIAFPKQGSRGAPSSTEGNYSHVARVIGRIFNRCRELIFSVAQSITCPWRNAHARRGGGNGRRDGWPGRGGGEGDRSSEGARGRSTKLGHWSFIHITRPFMRFANRSAFMLSTHFFVFFEKTFFFSLSLSLVSNSEKTVSPIHAHLPRQPPARLSFLFTFKVTKRNRGITRRIWTRISFFHSSVIQTRTHVQIPLRDFYFILENCISFSVDYSQ